MVEADPEKQSQQSALMVPLICGQHWRRLCSGLNMRVHSCSSNKRSSRTMQVEVRKTYPRRRQSTNREGAGCCQLYYRESGKLE